MERLLRRPVGFGIFAWDGFERRSKRYGSFVLILIMVTAAATPYFHDVSHLVGKKAIITAKAVIENEKAGILRFVLGHFSFNARKKRYY